MKRIVILLLLLLLLPTLLYCLRTPLLHLAFSDTEAEVAETLFTEQLNAPVTISRNALGMPLIEAQNLEEVVFGAGFSHAQDRLGQMSSMKLLAQGRLSEMAGPDVLPLDKYIRTINLRQQAINIYTASSDSLKALLQSYANGVNYYLEHHREQLPPALALADYQPEPWSPLDSVYIFALLNYGLSTNLHQEIANLNLLKQLTPEQLAWLNPIYPDQALPFAEADKLKDIDYSALDTSIYSSLHKQFSGLLPRAVAASNNWAIHKDKTANGASIVANDTHLPLSLPSIWSYIQLKTPDLNAAGISVPGLPAVVAGYNGTVAWGMTMVMADTQDIYLEKLKEINGQLHYLYEGQWLPTRNRLELLRPRDGETLSYVVYETHHGPLLNDVLSQGDNELSPKASDIPFGIAYRSHDYEQDKSLDAFFSLITATSFDEAHNTIGTIEAIPLNMVYGDKDNIAWKVTGYYPVRKQGLGLLPSPGWVDDYEWSDKLSLEQRPGVINPEAGFVGTANHRLVAKDYPHTLSSSWYYPERGERIDELANSEEQHTLQSSQQMQLDHFSRLVAKIQSALTETERAEALQQAIKRLPAQRQQLANSMLDRYLSITGDLAKDNHHGLIQHLFLDNFTRALFLDEIGPTSGEAWQSFIQMNDISYSAPIDHILHQYADSPFWDNHHSPDREMPADILAQALANAEEQLITQYGDDEDDWHWGEHHQYHFRTNLSRASDNMTGMAGTALASMSGFFDRGPFPAAGDFSTLNVTGHTMTKNYDVWLIPEMRIVVDFSREEPMYAINSTGQSENPVSKHYDDGIEAFLDGDYLNFPFKEEALRETYQQQTRLQPQQAQ